MSKRNMYYQRHLPVAVHIVETNFKYCLKVDILFNFIGSKQNYRNQKTNKGENPQK